MYNDVDFTQWFFKDHSVRSNGCGAIYINRDSQTHARPVLQLPKCRVPFRVSVFQDTKYGPPTAPEPARQNMGDLCGRQRAARVSDCT